MGFGGLWVWCGLMFGVWEDVGDGMGRGNLKIVFFYPKREITSTEHEVLIEKLKTILPAVILKKKKNPDHQLHQIFKAIKKYFCTFLPI